jgi:DNA-binding beta-propeller fold protein YncE
MEKQVMVTQGALVDLQVRCEEISNQRETTADNIHATFSQLQEVLTAKKSKLISQLDQVTQEKLNSLTAQMEKIEVALGKQLSCLYFMKESYKKGKEEDALTMKSNTFNQVEKLATPYESNMFTPNMEADIEFLTTADMMATCENFGEIFYPGLPDPSKCHITAGLDESVVGGRSSAFLQVVNHNDMPCEELVVNLECEVVSELVGTAATCSIERRGQGQYEITYHPTIKGRHQIHIKVEGQPISRSPFSVAVMIPVDKLGSLIRTIDTVMCPWGVAVNQKGEVVVTEETGHCVSVFRPDGEKIRSFGTRGSGPGELENPHGVAFDGEGNILVADKGNHRIQKFTMDGKCITAVGSYGNRPLQWRDPIGIVFNTTNNKVYVTDQDNHRVQVLNFNLTFSGTFGKHGNTKGQFQYPTSIASDSTGNIYVADSGNYRIQVFTAGGKFLRKFGGRGQSTGELDWPVGVAVDAHDLVFVSEWSNRVSVFTTEGRFVTSFGRRGEGPGEFTCVRGLAVDIIGVVYVCDHNSNRVQLF